MKVNFKILALSLVLGTMAVGCQTMKLVVE
jgi:hypothetical protein